MGLKLSSLGTIKSSSDTNLNFLNNTNYSENNKEKKSFSKPTRDTKSENQPISEKIKRLFMESERNKTKSRNYGDYKKEQKGKSNQNRSFNSKAEDKTYQGKEQKTSNQNKSYISKAENKTSPEEQQKSSNQKPDPVKQPVKPSNIKTNKQLPRDAKSRYFEISVDEFEENKSLGKNNANNNSSQKNLANPTLKKTVRKPTLPSSLKAQRKSLSPSSLTKGPDVNEDEIPTAAFKKPRILNTIDGKNIRPLPKPHEAFVDNMDLLKSDEWEEQVEGIETLVRFAAYHPKLIQSNMKEMNGYLMKHAKNLRSQVCRAALQAITYFYDCLKKSMEPDLDKMVVLLLNKTADTNKFLREDSNFALDAMVEVTTPSKAVSSLVQEGSGHRNPQVRATLGRLLAYTVELFGASKTLNQKDVADKLLPAATKLAQDGSLESRQMAKLIFQRLATQPQFESSLKKYVQSEDVRQIQKFLDNLYSNNVNKKGIDASRTKASKGGGRFGRRY
ncbi:hypothetical protein Anas_08973 [Armadillidium nasatum]|uniref:TOG domain-containing protein n=1 Tax=Armadillidium nasatum TaxID=96803 RepID=A0A5N5SXD9_9CRUS|nr:hypothetical protein Anas_08973 [Armadillidium nasatum]